MKLSTLALALAFLSVTSAYRVRFDVQLRKGKKSHFVLAVHPEWAPLGEARFRELIDQNYFKGLRFFRVVPNFVAQFGIHGNPEIASKWQTNKIEDDPVVESNKRGTLVFATSGANSRTTQLFLNFKDNANLDGMGFAPFAEVVEGMETCVDLINDEYREKPNQGQIQSEGNRYLKTQFPNLSYILGTTGLDDDKPEL
mmetsp:Transcript_20944/g.23306  ORF Transcript_20944/g.23306 Transcript_20944/m.23306 type:complete len:198 (+) Transcript_20944:27-620(+)|eukprot:CAMPEP_0205826858 /NCGR_PEP_ID=MMETSP0206-20130828/30093_1 /ASSEMBLY_ACC=CAM_ASM_000279 /TAXON_ID=36767 /ORGANISM="Euplotes focardii, Strain TN1" /LENGTH=197 /DNA_ID=CAMNT_0053127161 /DNA_START=22 /DNA_END=615 /DNA_ORIENTATION=+